jgi:HEAT repeat protein
MKIHKLFTASLAIMLLISSATGQDNRSVETNVEELIANFPANNLPYTDKLMEDMLALGEKGLKLICDKIIPAGTGDDTLARFAVESLSRFLSGKGREAGRMMWEKICIHYATAKSDTGVKDFFITQLQLIGGNSSVEALKDYLADREICGPALAVIISVGGRTSEIILAEALKNKNLPCAAAVMNALAFMNSVIAVNEYIMWSSNISVNIRASAYNALARSGSPQAYPVLLKAAREVKFRWEHTGAVASLLTFARVAGENGDVKTLDRICKLVIARCNDKITMQNKIAALTVYTGIHGKNAMNELLKATGHPDKKYRNAALNLSLSIPGTDVVQTWVNFFPRAIPEARPEIITMLGIRGDMISLPLLNTSLSDADPAVRTETAYALAKISGSEAIPALLGYMTGFTSSIDQAAVRAALMSVMKSEDTKLLRPVLTTGPEPARKTAVEILAWSKLNEYITDVIPLTSSGDESVRSAAFKALATLAVPENRHELIILLSTTDDKAYLSDIQSALTSASALMPDAERRSDLLISAFVKNTLRLDPPGLVSLKMKIIPVLADIGGREAMAVVLKEFEEGTPEMREVCFRALSSWRGYSAASALFEICASRNKTYEGPAFDGYLIQVRTAPVPDEQKLLLYRKIMPFTLSAERKNRVIAEIGRLKTYQSLFFVAEYLDDPETSATAARSAMQIALPSITVQTGMYGTLVREILTKTVPNLAGMEAEYDRELVNKYLDNMQPGEGFKRMFNGMDLSGWMGLVQNPVARAKMKPAELAGLQVEADKRVTENWSVNDGAIWFSGRGDNLCSAEDYADFEMLVDWKISKGGDSGIYLRGSPQVQIWDTSRVQDGAQVGSGGLYNNLKNQSKPLKVADNPAGDWNTFRIIMTGEKVSVWLNGELVVDEVVMENYWDRSMPIFPTGPIELQAHGTDLAFRDIYVREIK